MDASAIGRFHATVEPLPMDSFEVPEFGLSGFLRKNLRFKVFLVSIAVFDDRWATNTRAALTSNELREIRVCMRIIVDYMVRRARNLRAEKQLTRQSITQRDFAKTSCDPPSVATTPLLVPPGCFT